MTRMHYRHRKSKTLSLCGSQAQPKEQSLTLKLDNLPNSSVHPRFITRDGYIEFFKHVDHKEAWYEYANCKVNVRIIDNQCIGPSPDFDAADFPCRTACIKDDESWHVHEENLKIDPPVEDLEKDIEVHEVIVTIFSKEQIDLYLMKRSR